MLLGLAFAAVALLAYLYGVWITLRVVARNRRPALADAYQRGQDDAVAYLVS